MNTIYYSKRHELKPNYYVIPFSCTDLGSINTEALRIDRSDAENKVLDIIRDRITLALQNHGLELESVNFRNMSISATKTGVL